ncbi:MAG: YkgJ family cysteine cluster protein [Candidatus Bathyarchaeota archaeon]|nr:YkgJ family cysteine cluster protein [Candidatus Bathyarchaeota archaeon]
MTPVPWSYLNSWYCTCCGLCCREFDVVLRFDEWLSLVRTYGVGVTKAGLDKLYMGKKSDGSCLFLYNSFGKWFCGLQRVKPRACKLWPFKLSNKPRYGRSREASFDYKGKRLYIYVDPFCPEIRWGKPSERIVHQVIPEFIELALGLREKQVHSTYNMKYDTPYPIGRTRYWTI